MDLIDTALSNPNLEAELFKAKIAVAGIGGGGSNTVQRLARLGVRGATLIAVNTDQKHINTLDPSIKRILIGGAITRGLGAGGFAEIGAKAAEYSRSDIGSALQDYNLVFITAGMGGGTGTGAAPVVADIAKKNGAIVIGIVTFPFRLERVRIEVARKGIETLSKNVDTLIVIDNQRLVNLYPNLAIDQAFKVADEVSSRAVRGITEAINTPSLINIDYADIRTVLNTGGLAMISVGEGKGTNKVNDVVEDTLRNKLLDVDYEGINSALIHITGGEDLTLGEANEIGRLLTEQAAPTANVVWGARIDSEYKDKVSVIAIFTGVKSASLFNPSGESERRHPDFELGAL